MSYPLSRLLRAPAKIDAVVRDQLFYWRYHEHAQLLSDYLSQRDQLRNELDKAHDRYTAEISTPSMAVSLEAASLLSYLCRRLEPKTILDLGSGFSSVVFRTYASTTKSAKVISVDDNPEWLTRTGQFLTALSLPTDNLMTWNDLSKLRLGPVDLIFHDLGLSALRCEAMPVIPSFAHERTALVVDDTHKADIRAAVAKIVQEYRLRYTDLAKMTMDSLGRSQWFVSGFSGPLVSI